MSYYPGIVDQYGRKWTRCGQCGDSHNPNHAHCAVYPDGGSYCFRCGHFAQTDVADIIDLLVNCHGHVSPTIPSRDPSNNVSLTKKRPTALTVLSGLNTEWDYFHQRDQFGNITGWYGRHPFKREFNTNGMGFGYVGDTLTSSPSNPLILVEGPYDCISDRCVCVFGSLSFGRIRHLKLQSIWLWPDPDMVSTNTQRIQFWSMIDKLREHLVLVDGVIVSNADPDEATQQWHYNISQKYMFIEGVTL